MAGDIDCTVHKTVHEYPQFCIQEDWNEVLPKDEGKPWISVKPYYGKTVRGFITANDTPNKDFTVKSYSNNSLTVSCANGECTFQAPNTSVKVHEKPIVSCDISASGGLGVIGSHDGHMTIWDTSTGVVRRVLEGHVADITSCRFFPSGVVVLSGSEDFQLKVWSAVDGRCARTLKGHTRRITATCIIERGRNIISSSADGSAKLWDCGSGQCIRSICTHSCIINDCTIMRDTSLPLYDNYNDEREVGTSQKVLCIGCEDGTLKTYDIRDNHMTNEYSNDSNGEVTHCVCVQDKWIISGYQNGRVSCHDTRTNMLTWTVSGLSTSAVTSLSTIHDNTIAIGYRDGTCIMVKDMVSPEKVTTVLTGPNLDPITSIVINNNVLYTGCRDGIVRYYRI